MSRNAVVVCCLAILLALSTGCSRVGRALGDMRDKDPLLRAAAAESLGVWRATDATSALMDALADSVPGVRERAAASLGELGDRRAVSALLPVAMSDADTGVARYAARALAALAADSVAEIVARSLEGTPSSVRLRAGETLATIFRSAGGSMESASRARLGAVLGDVTTSTQRARHELPGNWRAWDGHLGGRISPEDSAEVVADQVSIALAWLGGAESGTGLLKAILGTTSPLARDSLLGILALRDDEVVIRRLAAEVRTNLVAARHRAIDLLGGLPTAYVVRALAASATEPRSETRHAAWEALVRIHGYMLFAADMRPPTASLGEVDPAVVAATDDATNDAEPATRLRAAFLRAVADPAASTGLAAIRPRDPATSEALCNALGALSPHDSTREDAVLSLIASSRSQWPRVRRAAIVALSRWDAVAAVPHVRSLVADPDTSVAHAALRAATKCRERSLIAAVMPKLEGHAATRQLAAEALAALADSQSVTYLVLGLTNDGVERRQGSVEAIRIVAKRVWNTPLEASYRAELSRAEPWLQRMAVEESEPRDRARAARAVGYMPSYESNATLGVLLGDEVEEVRLAAATGLGRLRPLPGVGPLRALALGGAPETRTSAVRALATLGSEPATEALRMVSVVDASPAVRNIARKALDPARRGN